MAGDRCGHLCTSHIAAAKTMAGGFQWTVVSSYFQYSESTQVHADALESALDEIGADVNARAAASSL